MKPRLTPCVSLNLSLYCLRISIMRLISTSLKVVSIAVVFFDSTSLRLIVLRRLLIFSLRSLRLYKLLTFNAFLPGCSMLPAHHASIFFRCDPVGFTVAGSTFLSAMIADATGVLYIVGYCSNRCSRWLCCRLLYGDEFLSFCCGACGTGAGLAASAAGAATSESIMAITSPIFNTSPSCCLCFQLTWFFSIYFKGCFFTFQFSNHFITVYKVAIFFNPF